MNWTDLPGPKAFLAMVEQDLRDSKSVLAVVPSCFDDQWIGAIRSRTENCYEWREIPNVVSEFLGEVSTRDDGLPLAGVRELIEQGLEMSGFVIRNPAPDDWERWIRFLAAFSELNRNLPEIKRSVFLVATAETEIEMPNEPLLSERRMEGCIRREDSLIHALQNIEDDANGDLWRRIRIHVASELAIWDFRLCEALCDLPARQLLDPLACLKDYAAGGGIGTIGPEAGESKLRREGLLFTVAGEALTHSALLAAQGRHREVERRIWTAQVRVLFPLIEDQRIRMLERLRKIHSSTVDSWERELEKGGELEIGFLHHRMLASRAFPRELNNLAGKLKNIRNKLAHLQICGPNDLPSAREWLP